MIRKMLLAAAMVATFAAHADYPCSVTLRDDVILSPQFTQVSGENGNLVITPDGKLRFNGNQYPLSATQRKLAQDYQAALRDSLAWIDNGIRARLEKSRAALDKIITGQLGENSNTHNRLTILEAQLKQQINRIIERRDDGLTFHYQAIDQVQTEGQQLVNQTLGGLLQDSINEISATALIKGDGSSLRDIPGILVSLQADIQNEWKNQEADFRQFTTQACQKVTSLEARRKALVGSLKSSPLP